MGYVSETNEGYINSGIPIRVEAHCVGELSNFVETPASSGTTRNNFAQAKGSMKMHEPLDIYLHVWQITRNHEFQSIYP